MWQRSRAGHAKNQAEKRLRGKEAKPLEKRQTPNKRRQTEPNEETAKLGGKLRNAQEMCRKKRDDDTRQEEGQGGRNAQEKRRGPGGKRYKAAKT